MKECVSFQNQLFLWYITFQFTFIILYILIFIISTNVDTVITLYLNYVFRLKLKKKKTIEAIDKTFDQITQVMQVARAMRIVPMKDDDQYIWLLMEVVVYSKVIVCENMAFCIIYWIVSQFKDNGLPISVTIKILTL